MTIAHNVPADGEFMKAARILFLIQLTLLAAAWHAPCRAADFADKPIRESTAKAVTAGDDIKVLRNAYLDRFAKYSASLLDLIAQRDYGQAEALLKEWEKTLEKARPILDEKQQLFSYGRWQMASGYLWESKGLASYFLDGDYVYSQRLFEKASIHHERAAELLKKVRFPEDAPPRVLEMQQNTVRMEQAEVVRVEGMKFLVEGDYESEAGNFDRALQALGESVKKLREAQKSYPAGVYGNDPIAGVMEKGQRSINFIDFAQALLHKTRSDQALTGGDFLAAAAEQKKRAEALRRAQTMHLRAGQPLHEGFAKRLYRDMHIANQRHDNLLAEAQKRSKEAWPWALAFFAMAMGSVVLFVWLSGRFELLRNRLVFALLLLFVMAVAGIGARQVNWKDAANWFKGSVGALSKIDHK